MHGILTEHAVYRRAVDEVARVKGAQRRHQEQVAKAEHEYREAAAAYQQAAVEALREGRDAPTDRPTPPEVDSTLILQLAQDTLDAPSILRDAERRLAPELLPQMEARAFEVEETIRQAADTMRGLAREASELRVTVAAQRAAAELPPLLDQGAVDVARLVDLVLRGDRLLAAESPTSASRDVGSWDWDGARGSHPISSFSPLAGRR